jgi:hypothetical protein
MSKKYQPALYILRTPPFIFPEDRDARLAVKTEKGYKCLTCQQDEIDTALIKYGTPGSDRVKEAVTRK